MSSCTVRRPIRFRPPSDQIPSAVRSDSVRRPIRFRSPSDQIPYGDGGISHPLRIKRLRRNNNGLSGCLQGGALVSSAPTKQAMHQPSKLCTNQASCAPTKQAVHQPSTFKGVHLSQVHRPSKQCTNQITTDSFCLGDLTAD